MNSYLNENTENNETKSIIINFIIFLFGIIFGTIIGYYIFKNVKYIGPDSNEIVKEIYTDELGRKFKFKPKITICPLNYSMNKLHDPNFREHH